MIEGTNPDAEVSYLLAYAIAQKKPLLLLLEKGRGKVNPLASLGKSLPPYVTVALYTNDTVEPTLVRFLGTLGDIQYTEVPNIKFTLRITPRIERYLHWKTHNTDVSKADFVRQLLLEQVIANDEEFKKYEERRKPKA